MSDTDKKATAARDAHAGRLSTVPAGDFGPVTMVLDRGIPGVLKIRLSGMGGDADAALRRWQYNFAYARNLGLTKILILLELSGAVIPESALATMIGQVAELQIADFRVAIVQTRHERQQQDELGTLIAIELGITTRVFPDEASALVWLRYGAS